MDDGRPVEKCLLACFQKNTASKGHRENTDGDTRPITREKPRHEMESQCTQPPPVTQHSTPQQKDACHAHNNSSNSNNNQQKKPVCVCEGSLQQGGSKSWGESVRAAVAPLHPNPPPFFVWVLCCWCGVVWWAAVRPPPLALSGNGNSPPVWQSPNSAQLRIVSCVAFLGGGGLVVPAAWRTGVAPLPSLWGWPLCWRCLLAV